MEDFVSSINREHRLDDNQAYALLVRAYMHAINAGCDEWKFAIAVEELKALGLHEVDLNWLLVKGYAAQGIETTIPGDMDRNFRILVSRVLSSRVCLVLTYEGFKSLGSDPKLESRLSVDDSRLEMPISQSTSQAADSAISLEVQLGSDSVATPVWDSSQRELWFGRTIVKRYKVPAPNQERILSAFQEEKWPHGIYDPLPPELDQDPIRRLQATIKSLNRNRINETVRFRGNGNGDRVVWEVV